MTQGVESGPGHLESAPNLLSLRCLLGDEWSGDFCQYLALTGVHLIFFFFTFCNGGNEGRTKRTDGSTRVTCMIVAEILHRS